MACKRDYCPMTVEVRTGSVLMAVAGCLFGFCGCHIHRQAPDSSPASQIGGRPDLGTAYRDFIPTLHPLSVYQDRGNVVVVQTVTYGVESGKYIKPLVSSYDRFGEEGDFILTPATGCPSCLSDGAWVYDYRKRQPDGPANRSQRVRSGTGRTSSDAGSGR